MIEIENERWTFRTATIVTFEDIERRSFELPVNWTKNSPRSQFVITEAQIGNVWNHDRKEWDQIVTLMGCRIKNDGTLGVVAKVNAKGEDYGEGQSPLHDFKRELAVKYRPNFLVAIWKGGPTGRPAGIVQ